MDGCQRAVGSTGDSADMRVCTVCNCALPISEFRVRAKGAEARHHQCRQCHAAAEKRRRARKRRREISHFAAQVNVARYGTQMAALVHNMVRRFGGPSGFADTWSRHIQAARPGSREAFGAINAFIKLWTLTSKYAQARQWHGQVARQAVNMAQTARK